MELMSLNIDWNGEELKAHAYVTKWPGLSYLTKGFSPQPIPLVSAESR